MAKKKCSAGQNWDKLVGDCVWGATTVRTRVLTKRPLLAVVEQVREKAPAPSPEVVMAQSPVLWALVVLATVGSMLVLALWLIIYRWQTRLSSSTSDAEPGQEVLHKPAATVQSAPSESDHMFPSAPEAPTPCSHRPPGVQAEALEWQEGRGPALHAGKEQDSRGQHVCSSVREHRIPLPATELGGTALVTTKTV